jgi:hypothetical protein
MKMDIDRHSPRPMPNNCKNFNPPNFSLPTTFKGLSLDGGRADFSKNRLRACDTSFNKDLSNEPNFDRVHLAGQYL